MAINLGNLNDEQQQAVTHGDGPLLIVAGAGTGKTTVITQRIAWLIEQERAKVNEILALTFTDKAAGEMAERLDQALPYGYVDLWVMTFHAFAEKILHQHALEIGIPNDFRLLNQTQQWLLVRQNLDRFSLDYYRPVGNPTKFIHALLKLFSRAKDDAITPDDYLHYAQDLKLNADSADFIKNLFDAETIKSLSKKERKELVAQEIGKQQEIADAYHTYQQLLLDHSALDFGDLIHYCLTLLQRRPAVLARYRQQFRYLLVDEFQDTNHAQYELVKLLAAPRNNVAVVGDDDQSIYKFRGASVSNILEFKHDFPKAKEVFLIKNYRSTQDILDLSYRFICQNNPNRLEVKLVKAGRRKLSKQLMAQTKAQGALSHYHYQTADDEVVGVLKLIDELKRRDAELTWNDFAILARTNEAANLFAHGLSRTQIPYRFLASRGLYTKPVVLDVLAYLRLLDNYHESTAVYRILNSSVVGLAHREVVNLNYWAKRKGYSLFSTLQSAEVQQTLKPAVRGQIQQFLNFVEKHSQLAKQKSVSETVMAFLEDTGYLKVLTAGEGIELLQSTAYLNQFYKKINDFERSTADPSVRNFLALIDLELEAGEAGAIEQELDEGPEAVKVMTVHGAKGLEFTHVFIINLVDRRFPTDDRPDPITLPDALIKEILPEGDVHLQEERRLFYVAMTRARRGLYFTSADDYGGARKKKISRFLAELGEQGFKLATARPSAPDGAAVGGRDTGSPHFAGEAGAVARATSRPVASPPPISRQDVAYLLPKRFSFTQLKAFERCPYHYWLEHLLKIPQPGKPYFSFGSSLHNTLQQFFLKVQERSRASQQDLFGQSVVASQPGKPACSLDELFELYERCWIDDWYQDRQQHDQYKANGKRALKAFYDRYRQELPLPKLLETPFNFNLRGEAGENYTIVGKIDRVDPLNSSPRFGGEAGGAEIIDYKTGQGKTEATLDTDDKQQLLIYQLAAQQLGERVERLTYYYLESGEQASFVGTEKDLAAIKQKVIKTIQAIRRFNFPAEVKDCQCRNNNLRDL